MILNWKAREIFVNIRRLKYLALFLPLLYLSYGMILALRFNSSSEFFNSLVNGMLLFIITYLLVKKAILKNWLDFIWFAVFILYIFILHHLVTYFVIGDLINSTYTGHFHIQKELINLTPFTTIENTFKQTFVTMPTIIQILGNVLLLFPLSFFLLYFKITKSVLSTLFAVFITSCSMEAIQFLQTTLASGFEGVALPAERSTDIDDIFLNTLSGTIGIIVAKAFSRIHKKNRKK